MYKIKRSYQLVLFIQIQDLTVIDVFGLLYISLCRFSAAQFFTVFVFLNQKLYFYMSPIQTKQTYQTKMRQTSVLFLLSKSFFNKISHSLFFKLGNILIIKCDTFIKTHFHPKITHI